MFSSYSSIPFVVSLSASHLSHHTYLSVHPSFLSHFLCQNHCNISALLSQTIVTSLILRHTYSLLIWSIYLNQKYSSNTSFPFHSISLSLLLPYSLFHPVLLYSWRHYIFIYILFALIPGYIQQNILNSSFNTTFIVLSATILIYFINLFLFSFTFNFLFQNTLSSSSTSCFQSLLWIHYQFSIIHKQQLINIPLITIH